MEEVKQKWWALGITLIAGIMLAKHLEFFQGEDLLPFLNARLLITALAFFAFYLLFKVIRLKIIFKEKVTFLTSVALMQEFLATVNPFGDKEYTYSKLMRMQVPFEEAEQWKKQGVYDELLVFAAIILGSFISGLMGLVLAILILIAGYTLKTKQKTFKSVAALLCTLAATIALILFYMQFTTMLSTVSITTTHLGVLVLITQIIMLFPVNGLASIGTIELAWMVTFLPVSSTLQEIIVVAAAAHAIRIIFAIGAKGISSMLKSTWYQRNKNEISRLDQEKKRSQANQEEKDQEESKENDKDREQFIEKIIMHYFDTKPEVVFRAEELGPSGEESKKQDKQQKQQAQAIIITNVQKNMKSIVKQSAENLAENGIILIACSAEKFKSLCEGKKQENGLDELFRMHAIHRWNHLGLRAFLKKLKQTENIRKLEQAIDMITPKAAKEVIAIYKKKS